MISNLFNYISGILLAAFNSDGLSESWRVTIFLLGLFFLLLAAGPLVERAAKSWLSPDVAQLKIAIQNTSIALWQLISRLWKKGLASLFRGRPASEHWSDLIYYSVIQACLIVSLFCGLPNLFLTIALGAVPLKSLGALICLLCLLGVIRTWNDKHIRALRRKRLGWLGQRLLKPVFN
jgi:hypothetical protein